MLRTTRIAAGLLLLAAATSAVSAIWLGPQSDSNHPLDRWLLNKMDIMAPTRTVALPTVNILNFGAIPNNSSLSACKINGEAFFKCMMAAADGKACLIPAGHDFSMQPYAYIENINNATLLINGNLSACQGSHDAWPCPPGTGNACNEGSEVILDSFHPERVTYSKVRKMNLFQFVNCADLTITSTNADGGYIHGHGFAWWAAVFKTHHDRRPNMFEFDNVTRLHISDIIATDSPRYHFYINAAGLLVERVRVEVSVLEQYQLHKQHGTLIAGIEITFPLNTDGIDASSHHHVVRNCHVENFDDALCSKPKLLTDDGGTYNQLFTDNTVHFGVGCSCGSVPPHPQVNSIQNVTFQNIVSTNPIKAWYVKPNPTSPGDAANARGRLHNILYKNMVAHGALWWSIWVSMQQQVQPSEHGAHLSCSFFFPLPGQKCPTQSNVPVTNLFLQNVTSHRPLLSSGILRGNNTNIGPGSGPFTGWKWNNVDMSTSILKWPVKDGAFLCHALESPEFTNVRPGCTYDDDVDVDEKATLFSRLMASEHGSERRRIATDPRLQSTLAWIEREAGRSGLSLEKLVVEHSKNKKKKMH